MPLYTHRHTHAHTHVLSCLGVHKVSNFYDCFSPSPSICVSCCCSLLRHRLDCHIAWDNDLADGQADSISSSLHVDAGVVAVPRRIVLCVPGQVSLLWARGTGWRGATAFYDAGKACELLLLSHLPLLSASSEHPTCTQQQMHFASATGSRSSWSRGAA